MPKGMVIHFEPRSCCGTIRESESGREMCFDRKSFADPFLARILTTGQYVTFGVIRDHHGERVIQLRASL